MKFLSPEVALYVCKSTICPCMGYCCHLWDTVASFSCNSMAHSGCSALHGVNPNYKEKKDSIFNIYFSKRDLHLLALFLNKRL